MLGQTQQMSGRGANVQTPSVYLQPAVKIAGQSVAVQFSASPNAEFYRHFLLFFLASQFVELVSAKSYLVPKNMPLSEFKNTCVGSIKVNV